MSGNAGFQRLGARQRSRGGRDEGGISGITDPAMLHALLQRSGRRLMAGPRPVPTPNAMGAPPSAGGGRFRDEAQSGPFGGY